MNKIVFEVQDELRKLSNSLTVTERQLLILSIKHDFRVLTERGVITEDYRTKYFDIYQQYRTIMGKLFIYWEESSQSRRDATDFYNLQDIKPEATLHEAILHYLTYCTPAAQFKTSEQK